MRVESWLKVRATRVAAICLATLFFACAASAQETTERITVYDVDRTYTVRLPRGYDPAQKHPVVILLHGMNQEAADMERLTRFDDLADKSSIIAVYPSALDGRWNVGVRAPQQEPIRSPMGRGGRRGGFGFPSGGGGYPGGSQGQRRGEQQNQPALPDDIAFLNQMLDQMATKYSVDTARVYATGLSEGGFMAVKVGCSMAERIAAIAFVGAAMPKTMVCLPSRPIAVVMINGTSDPVVPHGGGTEHNLQLPVVSVEDSAKAWARINRCAEKPTQTKLAAHEKGGMETKVETYDGCQQDAQVVSYSVKGGGNTWPGGEQYEVEKQVGKTSQDLNANETLWNFFVAKKLEVENETDKNGTGSSPNVK
jgi:polyhydroxybutyrate depolymerase